MNRVLSTDLWPTIARLAKKAVKRAAIAYVSSDEHLQFGEGDLLICDASINAIKSGQTSAAVLKRAHDRKAHVYSVPGLHAKVVLLNERALIGSANVSLSSANNLIEAGLLTDQPSIVAGAQSFVNQLAQQAEKLNERRLRELLAIEVVRSPWGVSGRKRIVTTPRNHRTWIVGTTHVTESPYHRQVVEERVEELQGSVSRARSTVKPLRWTGMTSFRKNCQEDDWIIQMWRPAGYKLPECVYQPMPVLKRVECGHVTYFLYEHFPDARRKRISFAAFKKLAAKAGIMRDIKPRSQFKISQAQVDLIKAMWKDV